MQSFLEVEMAKTDFLAPFWSACFSGKTTVVQDFISKSDQIGKISDIFICENGSKPRNRNSSSAPYQVDNPVRLSRTRGSVGNDEAETEITGRTCVHFVAEGGFFEPLEELLAVPGVEEALDAKDSTGKTPLHLACGDAGTVEVCEMLVEAGANAFVTDNDRHGIVHHAAIGGFVPLVKWAAKVWNEMNPTSVSRWENMEGLPALHVACQKGNTDAALALLEMGADPYHVTRLYGTALAVCFTFEQWSTGLALLEEGVSAEDATLTERKYTTLNQEDFDKHVVSVASMVEHVVLQIEGRVAQHLIADVASIVGDYLRPKFVMDRKPPARRSKASRKRSRQQERKASNKQ